MTPRTPGASAKDAFLPYEPSPKSGHPKNIRSNPVGLQSIIRLFFAPDGRSYVYSFNRTLS